MAVGGPPADEHGKGRSSRVMEPCSSGHYTALLGTLPSLINTAKALPDDPASGRAAYRAHHLAATTLMKYEGGTAAWHAAERARLST